MNYAIILLGIGPDLKWVVLALKTSNREFHAMPW